MKIQLNQGIELNIDDDIVFNNIAKRLGLPSDWKDCYIFDNELVREVRYGPEYQLEVVTNQNSVLRAFNPLKSIYEFYKNDHNKNS